MENKKPLLIIAERNSNVASLLARVFEENGWQAAVAGNGRDAWRLCRGDVAPRLLVLDEEIENPGCAALLEKIRLFRPEIPVILHVFSGSGVNERLRALAAKVVEKSPDIGMLLRASNRLGMKNFSASQIGADMTDNGFS